MQLGILCDVNFSIKKRKEFTVSYYPWTGTSPFIVAYEEVMESLQVNYTHGMRFEMFFDDEPQHIMNKFSGTIISKEDTDPVKWPQSEWKCLRVRWDHGTRGDVLPERVCPWQIKCLGMAAPHQRSSVSIDQESSMALQPMTYNLPFLRTSGQGNETATLSGVNPLVHQAKISLKIRKMVRNLSYLENTSDDQK